MATYIDEYSRLNQTLTGVQRLGWNGPIEQWMRFHALTKMLQKYVGPIPELSVHDVGCGFSDLLTHWKAAPPKAYIGSDCLREFVAESKSRHPAADIRLLDSLKQTPPSVDVSVMCGTLAMHKLPEQIALMEKVMRASKRAVLFTIWTGPSQGADWWKKERAQLESFNNGWKMITNDELYDMSEHMHLLIRPD